MYATDSTLERVQQFFDTEITDSVIATPILAAWTGVGWQVQWPTEDMVESDALEGVIPTHVMVMSTPSSYKLAWGASNGKVYEMYIRRTMHNPRQGLLEGIDKFARTSFIETSRFDMDMLGFTKIASHVIMFMRNASTDENVLIQYEVDDGGWEYFYDDDGVTPLSVTNIGKTIFPFRKAELYTNEVSSRGIPFNWIRFRMELNRGEGTVLRTPIIRAFNLHFLKVPQNSSTFQFTVPLPKRSFMGRGPQQMSDKLNDLLTAKEMVFLRHQNRLYRGRLAQVTGVDSTGLDFSGIRNINFVEILEEGGS
jgi:hypothetical protein